MLKPIYLSTIAEFQAAAPAWDDLWQRSDCTSPLAQAWPLVDWLGHFAPAARFQALVVADGDRWLAALPLVERRVAGICAGTLPCNAWPSGATLLWDTAASDDPAVGAAVLAAVARLPWPLVVLEAAMPARASWLALIRGLTAAGMPYDLRTRWRRPPNDRTGLAGGLPPPVGQTSPACLEFVAQAGRAGRCRLRTAHASCSRRG